MQKIISHTEQKSSDVAGLLADIALAAADLRERRFWGKAANREWALNRIETALELLRAAMGEGHDAR